MQVGLIKKRLKVAGEKGERECEVPFDAGAEEFIIDEEVLRILLV